MVTRKSDYKRPHGGFGTTHMGEDYTSDEIEFMRAMDTFKHKTQRLFPTCCEVLAVLQSLGYRKVAPPTIVVRG